MNIDRITSGITIILLLFVIILSSLTIKNNNKLEAHLNLSMYGTVEISQEVMIIRYDVPLDKQAYKYLKQLSDIYEIYMIDYTIGGDHER